jgi:hypothetical protein
VDQANRVDWAARIAQIDTTVAHPARVYNCWLERRYNERVVTPQTLRSRDQVAKFFDGLEFVPPGLVEVHG